MKLFDTIGSMGTLEQGTDIGMVQGVLPELMKVGELISYKPFDRTAAQVIGVDFLRTVHRIRNIYIPGGDNIDYPELIRSLELLKACPDSVLPERMLEVGRGNVRTILWWSEFSEKLGQDDKKMIAYNPDSSEGENDLRRATLSKFDQLRFRPWEGQPFDPNIDSITRTLWLLGKFFRSGGEFMKEEAVDILTWEMLKTYGVYLARRLE